MTASLVALQNVDDPTNWILLEYQDKDSVHVSATGNGGLEEFKRCLKNDQVQFGVLEFVVPGDDAGYATRKFVLLSWIGKDVPAGILKARSAGHRSDLRAQVHEIAPIAAEIQGETLDDFTLDEIGQAVSRMRGTYKSAVDATPQHKQLASGKGGTSRFEIVNEEAAVAALLTLKGDNDYCALATVAGSRGQYELIETGKGGVEALKRIWPRDRVYYCLTKINQPSGEGQFFQKFVLVALVGESVSPLARARTAAQCKEVSDWIIQYVPFHGLFQPNDPSDLADGEILKKFK